MRRSMWCVACALAVALSIPAHAEPSPRDPAAIAARTRALDLQEQAKAAYKSGDFAEASRLLRKAYEEYPSAILLYNLARAEEGLGHDAEAWDAYHQYLIQAPAAEDRKVVQSRMATIRARIDDRHRTQRIPTQRPSASAPPPPAEPTSSRSPMPWVLIATGGAALIVGSVFGVMARRSESHSKDNPSQQGALDDYQDAKDHARVANIGLTAGSVLLVAGATWYLLAPTPRQPATTAWTAGVGPGTVVVQGSF